jgi:superfamily II DNA or RNA helicase
MIELREWQTRAIQFFKENNNVALFQVVTGGGKTFFAIECIKQILKEDPNIYVLIVVPKNVIMDRGWYPELYANGISLKDIGVYYGAIKEVCKITITNMQNIDKLPLEMFDMLVADECHNYATTKQLKIMSHPFKYKIGLSATLKRLDKAHYELYKLFNYNIFKYDPKEALEDGVLNKFYFYNIGVYLDDDSRTKYDKFTADLNLILKQGGGFGKIMMSNTGLKFKMLSLMNYRKQLVNNYYQKFEVAAQICEKHKNDKVIIFNQFNVQTNKLYWYLVEHGFKIRVLHSDIDKEKREKTLTDFKLDRFNILLTTKVLDEGYNLPKLEAAIIMAADSTEKQTIQRLGRVLRKKDKHSFLYQIYCKHTLEEEQGDVRIKLFNELSEGSKDLIYKENEVLEIE